MVIAKQHESEENEEFWRGVLRCCDKLPQREQQPWTHISEFIPQLHSLWVINLLHLPFIDGARASRVLSLRIGGWVNEFWGRNGWGCFVGRVDSGKTYKIYQRHKQYPRWIMRRRIAISWNLLSSLKLLFLLLLFLQLLILFEVVVGGCSARQSVIVNAIYEVWWIPSSLARHCSKTTHKFEEKPLKNGWNCGPLSTTSVTGRGSIAPILLGCPTLPVFHCPGSKASALASIPHRPWINGVLHDGPLKGTW